MKPKLTIILFSAILIWGCGAMKVKPINKWTHKQRSAYFMSVYNAQHDDYIAQANQPVLKESEKKILREKKKVLKALKIAISSYDVYVSRNETPPYELYQNIDRLIDRVLALAEEFKLIKGVD